jgi:transposase-like protein
MTDRDISIKCPKHGAESMINNGISIRSIKVFKLFKCKKCDYTTDREITWEDFNREWA